MEKIALSLKGNRLVNFELLRILAMFLVIVGHYIFHGLKTNDNYIYWDVSTVWGGVNYVLIELTYIIACIAVNCYVLITGYFCINKTEFRWNGIIKTIIATLFYSIAFLALAWLFGKDVTPSTIMDALLPIHQEQYWFVTAYVGLMLIAPFLARLATILNKKQYQILLALLFVLSFEYLYGRVYAGLRSILFFSFLFLIAGYVKLYGVPHKWKENKGVIVLFIWFVLFGIATLTNIIFCPKERFLLRSSSNDCMILFLSVAVFVYFTYTNISNKPLIMLSKISPFVFGVYLVHDNPIYRKDLWAAVIPEHTVLPIAIYCLLVALIIFFIGVGVDFIRQLLFKVVGINSFGERLASKLPQL